MNISDVLSAKGRQVVTTSPTAAIDDVARKLVEYRIGYLVVCGANGVVVGVLSERDIIRGIAEQGSGAIVRKVADLMTPDPITCAPDDDPADVLYKMNQRGFRHMPVIEESRLKGIVSSRDIIKHLLERADMDKKTLQTLNELGIY